MTKAARPSGIALLMLVGTLLVPNGFAHAASTTYSVTYEGNGSDGGTAPTDGSTYAAAETVTVLGNTGNLFRTGYGFSDWNTAANGSGSAYHAGNTFPMPAANVTLYAQWRTVGLPDTGQALCDDGENTLVACTLANTGDAATYPRQDGRFGRDAKAAAGTLTKVGGGAAGFDYTKVANDGSDLAVGVAQGANPTDWACTRDNVTGLTWEVKTADGGLRDWTWNYTWYNSDAGTNGGNAGSTGSNTCGATLPSSLCNTADFAAAVNAALLCSYNDWRLPTQRELQTIVHRGAMNPSVDTTYFPNTQALTFWSGSSYVRNPAFAWFVNFYYGFSNADYKSYDNYARLVRGGQF